MALAAAKTNTTQRRVATTVRLVDILVNDAAMANNPHALTTVDKMEMAFEVDYPAPWLLTTLLLPQLRKAADGQRVAGTRQIPPAHVSHGDATARDLAASKPRVRLHQQLRHRRVCARSALGVQRRLHELLHLVGAAHGALHSADDPGSSPTLAHRQPRRRWIGGPRQQVGQLIVLQYLDKRQAQPHDALVLRALRSREERMHRCSQDGGGGPGREAVAEKHTCSMVTG